MALVDSLPLAQARLWKPDQRLFQTFQEAHIKGYPAYRGGSGFRDSRLRRLHPQPKATRNMGLQVFGPATLSVGSKSQLIGAKEQGPKRAWGRPLAYMKFASPSSHWQSSCTTMSREFSAPICAGDGEAQRYVGREGAYPTHVRAHRAQSSSTPRFQRLNGIMTRWHRLIQIACNPYRPELHYMRGPGPKWCAKHEGRTESCPL